MQGQNPINALAAKNMDTMGRHLAWYYTGN